MDTAIITVLATNVSTALGIVGLMFWSNRGLRNDLGQQIAAQSGRIDAQGERIDEFRTELSARIDAQGARIDKFRTELGARIDAQGARIDAQGERIDAQGERIDEFRTELGGRIDAQAHANQQAHDAIGLRIDGLRTELGGRIDALDARVARTSDDVAFIRGRLTGQEG